MKLLFNTCCGCISLRTGCLIIGYLSLFSGIVSIFLTFRGMGAQEPELDVSKLSPEDKKLYNEMMEMAKELKPYTIVSGINNIVMLLIGSALLVTGVHQDKRHLIKGYLILDVITYIISGIVSILLGLKLTLILIWLWLAASVFWLYFFMVVRSYYYKMDDESRQPTVYSTA